MNDCLDEKKRRSNGSGVKGCQCDECLRMRKKNADAQRKAYAANPKKAIADRRAWSDAHPEKQREIERASKLKENFGLTIAEYEKMLSAQGGVCAICHKPCSTGKRLAVDHDRSCCP